MTLLIAGLILWIAAHFLKRLAPAARQSLQDSMGDASKGLIAGLLVLSVVLMVLGYRAADFIPVWEPPSFFRHLNNLLMVFAIALFGLGNSKSRLRPRFRHPMLWGFSIWAIAHLMVNGDLASIILFGVLLLWALAEMPLINRAVHSYVPYEGGSLAGDIRLGIITLVLYVIIVLVHGWVGPIAVG